MKTIRFHGFGDTNVLRYEDAPRPAIQPNGLLLRLEAAALNHLDVFVRSGARERDIPLPHIPGSDGAGVIAEVGTAVEACRVGDKVLISPGISCGHCIECSNGRDNFCRSYHVLGTKENGTYAEYVAIPAANVVPIPEGLTFEEAAAVPLVFLTAWHMLVTLANIRSGETVLVHGAGSGVGSAAIQIAKLFGAHVITTAGSEEKLAKATALGADELINYRENDFVDEVKRLTGKRGVDIVFEHIGGDVFRKSLTVVTKGGRLVTCGSTTDFSTDIDLRYIYSRHQTIFGSWMGTRPELREVLKYFTPGVGNNAGRQLRPVIDSIFPLAQAAEAQSHMEDRKNFGKIVLKIS